MSLPPFCRLPPAHWLLSIVLLVFVVACSDNSDDSVTVPVAEAPAPEALPEPTYEVRLQRTEGGMPHVSATDFGSLGFGTGYVAAQDNFCVVAESVLKFRGERSLNFGPGDGNLDSDFFYKFIEATGQYDLPIDPELTALFEGYANGFNRYLRNTGVDDLPHPDCRGAQWLPSLTLDDVRRIHLTPFFLPFLSSLIIPAAPPAAAAAGAPAALNAGLAHARLAAEEEWAYLASREERSLDQAQIAAVVEEVTDLRDKGSNGVAIGRDLAENGRGLLYSNAHFSWTAEDRFYPMHQVIPGVLNVMGAMPIIRANVGWGTNEHVAWTNTVTTSTQLMFYKLDLVPGQPTRYIFDGEELAMEEFPVTVQSMDSDGNVTEESRSFYQSRFGPMLGGQFPWLTSLAFTVRFADVGSRANQGGALAGYRVESVEEYLSVQNTYQANPTNHIAVDKDGNTLYGDIGPVANFTDQQLVDCVFSAPVYLGNSSDCDWNTDVDSAVPGLLGGAKQADLFRTDYVTNSNDSYWLANPNAPLNDGLLIQGDQADERTLRTRAGLTMVAQRQAGTDGLAGTTFNLESLLDRMVSNQNYVGQLLRDDLVTLCEANPSVVINAASVDISAACTVLADWDLHSNLDSRGAHLFREFMVEGHALNPAPGRGSNTFLPVVFNYSIPFSVEDPVNTPRGLDTVDNAAVLESLARAVTRLNAAGIALDARLGDVQQVTRNGEVIPMHGGEDHEGVFNKMSLQFEGEAGYPEVTGSSASWVMATQFTETGPRVKALLAYSPSTSSESPFFSNQTSLFSEKNFLDYPFFSEDVDAAAVESQELAEGAMDCADDGWQGFSALEFADEEACVQYFVTLNDNRVSDYVDD